MQREDPYADDPRPDARYRTTAPAREAPAPRAVAEAEPSVDGSSAITPVRVFLLIALVGAVAFAAYALTVRDQLQVPMLASAAAVVGVVLAMWAIAFAVGIRRSSIAGHDGRALLFGFVGGLFGVAALGAFAATMILVLLWRP